MSCGISRVCAFPTNTQKVSGDNKTLQWGKNNSRHVGLHLPSQNGRRKLQAGRLQVCLLAHSQKMDEQPLVEPYANIDDPRPPPPAAPPESWFWPWIRLAYAIITMTVMFVLVRVWGEIMPSHSYFYCMSWAIGFIPCFAFFLLIVRCYLK